MTISFGLTNKYAYPQTFSGNTTFSGNSGMDNTPEIKLNSDVATDVLEIKNQNKGLVEAVDKLDKKASKSFGSKAFETAAKTISPVRKLVGAKENLENGNPFAAVGLATLATANLPQDLKDMKLAVECLGKKDYHYDTKVFQHPFAFLRGTLFEKPLIKLKEKNPELYENIYKQDVSLFETKIGKKIRKKLGIVTENIDIVEDMSCKSGNSIIKYQLGGTKIAKLVGEGMLRTSKLGVYALALLELPSIIKAFSSNKENNGNSVETGTKQVVKSGVKVASVVTGMGLLGAKLKRVNPFLGLVGMGLGAVAGSAVAEKTGEVIDRV